MRRSTWLWLLLIVVLAATLRFARLTSLPPGLDIDEATNGNNAIEALETGRFHVFYPENDGREGLFINLQALSLTIFGRVPWALRVVSAVFGTLTVLGVFLLAREIFGWVYGSAETRRSSAWTGSHHAELYGLVCAFLVAVSSWHLTFSRNGFRAISAPFFLSFGFYSLFRALRRIETDEPGSSLAREAGRCAEGDHQGRAAPALGAAGVTRGFDAVVAGLFLGLGLHTYISVRLMPLVLAAALWLRWRELRAAAPETKRALVRTGAIVTSVIAVLAAPLALYFLTHPDELSGRAMKISLFHQPAGASLLNVVRTLGMFNVSGDHNWRHNIPGRPLLWWPVGIAFLVGVVLSVAALLQGRSASSSSANETTSEPHAPDGVSGGEVRTPEEREADHGDRFPYAFLLCWLGIMLVPNLLSSDGSPHSLRALVTLPPVFLLSGLGVVRIGEWIASRLSGARRAREARPGTLGRSTNDQATDNVRVAEELTARSAGEESVETHAVGGPRARAPRWVTEYLLLTGAAALAILHIAVTVDQYFRVWGKSASTAGAFDIHDVDAAAFLRSLPPSTPKYVVMNVDWDRVVVRGVPSTAQTMIFLLGGWDEKAWARRSIRFIHEADLRPPPEGLDIPEGSIIVPLQDTLVLELSIRQRWPGAQRLDHEHFRAYAIDGAYTSP